MSMTPIRMRRLGLTLDPSETGVIHDVYSTAETTYYLTAVALRDVKRRARNAHASPPVYALRAMADPEAQPPTPSAPVTLPGMTVPTICAGCGETFARPAGGRESRRRYCTPACRTRATSRRYAARQRDSAASADSGRGYVARSRRKGAAA